MNREQGKDLLKGLAFILGLPLLFIVGVILYMVYSIPGGTFIENEVGEPLAVGQTWTQGEWFELTLTEVAPVSWTEADLRQGDLSEAELAQYLAEGYRPYALSFNAVNHQFQGYTDYYQSGKPFVEGLTFWLTEITGVDDQGKAAAIQQVVEYQWFPERSSKLKPDQRLEAKCYVLAAPTAVRLTVVFAANREARPEADKKRGPRPLYMKKYDCPLSA